MKGNATFKENSLCGKRGGQNQGQGLESIVRVKKEIK